jgi:tripartite-type tricarboxylate transporter receptor subunit TctC
VAWKAALIGAAVPSLRRSRNAAHARVIHAPVRMIVPYPAGGTTDILPRIGREWLGHRVGPPM